MGEWGGVLILKAANTEIVVVVNSTFFSILLKRNAQILNPPGKNLFSLLLASSIEVLSLLLFILSFTLYIVI